ncbi:MAG: hypothetical protein ACOY45_08130 [Pseudomonadota bacterium]
MMVKAIIETMPGHFAPDEHNLLPDGSRYKAPDHSAFGGYLLIERKSRPDEVSDKVVRRLKAIGEAQGWRGGAYGMVRIDRIMADFPDPVTANREITDYILGQLLKQLREAKKKFIAFAPHNRAAHSVRIVIVSDHSTQPGGNAADEAFIGRKMGGYDARDDQLPHIDAVILLKHPRYVFDEENSYWLKCLIRGSLSEQDRDNVVQLASVLHDSFAALPEFTHALTRLKRGHFRPLIVGRR